ncbi:HdeD family acid-resistance protein [Parapusillimonas granuli]|uniref:HdeD family acid-resistance protein n=1 Tax=Parapusillimonas granuli TaxID=380911 RepID=A0A853G2M7_9BURK|nr:HdeD family acid-resistance protein [Parapusillimonas granuli]MBB5214846.1 uncharacterized membrane protein HdeD (DUF308 family) [Parapusillimonas granuli]MEB2397906.1 HdeD family acid-resistance protein [Alcaligenaceae bacterium]NYT48746.1 HdeD family acid-resistance protein [Parapusillimonas granuli]
MTDPLRGPTPDSVDLAAALTQLRARWGWFVALGAVLVVLGVIAMAYIFAATLVSVLFIGAMMLAGGVGQLIHAWRIKHMSGFLFWTLSGLLYAGAGLIAIVNPAVGASALTLLLGASLIGVGALRLWIWFNNRAQPGWKWLAFSGIITLLTGVLIAVNWPGNSAWILGLLLAFDLLFQGWTSMLVGFALRERKA